MYSLYVQLLIAAVCIQDCSHCKLRLQ